MYFLMKGRNRTYHMGTHIEKLKKRNINQNAGWLVGCRVEGRLSHWGPRRVGGMPSVGVFLRDPSPYLREFRRKTAENSERLGRQARPSIEPGTSRLPF